MKGAAKEAAVRQRQLQADADARAARSSEAQQQEAAARQRMQLKVLSLHKLTCLPLKVPESDHLCGALTNNCVLLNEILAKEPPITADCHSCSFGLPGPHKWSSSLLLTHLLMHCQARQDEEAARQVAGKYEEKVQRSRQYAEQRKALTSELQRVRVSIAEQERLLKVGKVRWCGVKAGQGKICLD